MNTQRKGLLDLLHVSGSIASIAGISILIIEKSINNINIGYIISYLLSGFLVISFLALFISLDRWVYLKYLSPLEQILKYGLTLLLTITLLVFLILFVRLIFELFTPFVIILINGQY